MSEDIVDERLYELIVESQSDRLEDQRSELGGIRVNNNNNKTTFPQIKIDNLTQQIEISDLEESQNRRLTEEEDVTDLVIRMQMGRLEEQRANFSPSSRTTDELGISNDENGMQLIGTETQTTTQIIVGQQKA